MQLGAVALVIQAIFDHLGLSAAFVFGMLAIAALTAARRIGHVSRARVLAAAAIAVAAVVALVPLFVVNAFPLTPRY